MRVLHVCSELYPILKTGGLADVAGALPPALSELGVDSRILVPGFPAFMAAIPEKSLVASLPAIFGADSITIYASKLPDTEITIYIIDAPGLYDRPGNPYSDENNQAYQDNYRRFALLGWVAARFAEGIDSKWTPEVIHGHDWHAGLTPAYLKASELATGRKLAGSVFTVHNLAYQGVFPSQIFSELDLPNSFFSIYGLEFYGQVSFLKAGLYFADKITTVSPSYAKEIQTLDQGCGLDGLLSHRKNDLHGILNGVDQAIWNPSVDPIIEAKYSAKSVAGKLKCKTALQEMMGLTVQNDTPLFGVVSRLTEQKGLNLVLAGLNEILKRGGQIVILGSGDKSMEEAFKSAEAMHPGSIAVKIGYDEELAHRIVAGSDVILVPSRFEPCGLTQLYGLNYGTLPLVREVGGLADTVIDSSLENLADSVATGFVFNDFTASDYLRALRRAFALFQRKTDWKKVQKCAMQQQFGWDSSASKYQELYQEVAVN